MDFSDLLFFLIKRGDDGEVIALIESFDLHRALDSTQTSLLHYCAKFGNVNLTKYLLDKDCPVDAQNKFGKTPMIMALRRNCEKVIETLLESKSDILALNADNKNVLHYLATKHRLPPSIFKLIFQELQKRCSTDEEIAKKMFTAGINLYQASYLNKSTVLEYLLRDGLLSTSKNPVNKRTPMHVNVSLNNVEGVKLLLQYSADVNAVDEHGIAPVYYLYKLKNEKNGEKIEIMRMLLDSKVSLTSCLSTGIFQVTDILIHGTHEVIKMILQSNIDFSAADECNQNNILHYLAMNCNFGVTKVLEEFAGKLDVNVVNKNKTTPIFVAIASANVNMVKFLLDNDADSNFVRKNGFTPLLYVYTKTDLHFEDPVYEKRYEQCAELLLHHKADPQVLVFNEENGETDSIFDIALKGNSLHRLNIVIAHLALLEAQGTSITEIIYSTIKLHQDLENYFNKCKNILKKKIFGTVTVLQLITSEKKKLALYLQSEKSVLKLKRLKHKSKAMIFYSYFYNTLRKSAAQGLHYKRLRNEASQVITKALQAYIPRGHLVLHKLVDYFNTEDLCQFQELHE